MLEFSAILKTAASILLITLALAAPAMARESPENLPGMRIKDAMTIGDLFNICTNPKGAAICMGYIHAAFDMYRSMRAISVYATKEKAMFGCLPEGITRKDVLVYLLENGPRIPAHAKRVPAVTYFIHSVFISQKCD